MHEFDQVPGSNGLEAAIRSRRAEPDGWPFPGRHESHAEIRDETPIFHALTVGGWRDRGRGSATGTAVRQVHRTTVRTRRAPDPRRTAETVAAFHAEPSGAPVPVPAEPVAAETLRRRRGAQRAADRAAIAHLLGGAGRHRLSRSA